MHPRHFLGCALACSALLAHGQSNPGVPWPATDALGRSLPLSSEVGPPRTNRFVGIFYFLWLDQHRGPFDVSKILAADPDALAKPDSPLWGPPSAMHHWGESLYGYYRSNDPWVLRRHAQLLADAGVDTLIFDATNAQTYRDTYFNLCEVFTAIRREGGRTPQIAFMVNTKASPTAHKLFDDLYKPGHFRELWFQWNGRPLLICDPKEASPELRNFFTLRAAHWPFTMTNTKDAWHWEATFPQPYGFSEDPAKAEQVNVSVAQNLRASDGKVTDMSSGLARGRGFHDGKQDASPEAINRGANFAEQWKRVPQLDPPFVMVTGWNEWIAGRYLRNGMNTFVDQYTREFSRDIEPMLGGHGDNFLWQMIAGIRRYKGVPELPAATAPKTINITGDFVQWHTVFPEFVGHPGNVEPRNHAGFAQLHYTNSSGRNELAVTKVARDHAHVFFYLRTTRSLVTTNSGGPLLFLDTDRNANTGWAGYDFIVHSDTGWLEKNTGGDWAGDWGWTRVAQFKPRIVGNELHFAIPRPALGLANSPALALDFKWADNLQRPGDVMDFYVSGDVEPQGRFNFRYEAN